MNIKKSVFFVSTCIHMLMGGSLDSYTKPKEEHESTVGKSLDTIIVEPMFKASLKAAGAFLKHTPVYFFFQGMIGAPFYPYKATQEYALYKDDANKNVKIAMVMAPEAAGALLQMIIDQKMVHFFRTLVLKNPSSGIVGFLIDAGIGLGIHAIALYTYLKIKTATAPKSP